MNSPFNNAIRDTKRFRQVVSILAKYGLARWLSVSPVGWIKSLLKDKEGQRIADLTFEESVRGAITELGTTFIKLGQILSTRPDLIGMELAEELGQLRAEVLAESVESVLATIESELGDSVENLFASFDFEPLASASIAQVHRATTHDGREIVLKVQRKSIEANIKADLFILMRLAELAENHFSRLQNYQPVATAARFRTTLLRELDFQRELQNMVEFNQNFSGDSRVKFAQPLPEYSSRKVLAMDFVDGVRIDKTKRLEKEGHELSEVALRGARLFLDMLFRDGFYHADPHPGNLLVQKDGTLGVLDCGMVGRVEQGLRKQLEGMLLAIGRRDARRLARAIVYVGSVPSDFDEVSLETEVDEFLSEYTFRDLSELNLSNALKEVIALIRRHRIMLPSSLTLVLKVLIMLEGTSKILDQNFCLAEVIEPYQRELVLKRFSPFELKGRAEDYYRDWAELFRILPSDTADILDRVKRGKFDVHLDHRRLDTIVNRMVSGVLTAALFVGSAALWSQQVPPQIFNTSLPGALGCATALVLGYGIHRAIRHSGSLE